MQGSLLLLAILTLLAAYLAAPALVGLARHHPERRLIAKLSPLTLLSFVLWLALLAWAFTGRRDDARIARYVARLRESNRLPVAIAALVVVGLAGSLLTLVR
ncbi:hypothetical protein ACG3SL_01315 [Sphingomonas sp. CJ20]